MDTLINIVSIFAAYPFSISFLGSFFAGEEIILTLSYLSAQNIVPFWTIFIGAYLGTFGANITWFLIAKTKVADKILNLKYFSKAYEKIVIALDKSTRQNVFVVLLILKYAYGSRIITIFYLSREKLSLKKFLFYDSLLSLLWLIGIVAIGWLAGKGAERLIGQLRDFQTGLLVFIFFIVIIYISKIRLKKYLKRIGFGI